MSRQLIANIQAKFKKIYLSEPMVISSPGRINIIGEHTDYNEGFVFPAAIDKKIVLAIQKSKSDSCSVLADDMNETYEFKLDNIAQAETGSWKNYVLGVIREIQKKGYELTPFNIVFGGDIPGGAGLSSSAALENAVAFGINELLQLGMTREEMIFVSQMAEHNFVGVKCGIMDQYASMFGQENHLLLLDCRTIEAKSYFVDLKEYELILLNTNVKHSLSDTAYNDRRAVCENIAELLGKQALRDANKSELMTVKDQISEDDFQKALYVIQEIARTQLAAQALTNGNIEELGRLIYASHNGLQHQYKVSCDELDFLVDRAKNYKAVLGARMMGGGFGGCTINLIHKKATDQFVAEVSASYKKQFKTECSVYQVRISRGTYCVH